MTGMQDLQICFGFVIAAVLLLVLLFFGTCVQSILQNDRNDIKSTNKWE